MNCTRCGAELEAGFTYCGTCGAPVASQGPATQEPTIASAGPVRRGSARSSGWLEVESGPRQGQQFQLRGTMRIGRTEDNEIPLDDRQASRRHAAISREASGYVLQDLNSANGTYLNGIRVEEPRILTDGDKIQIGSSTLVFRRDPTATAPPPPPPTEAEPTISAPWERPPALVSSTRRPAVPGRPSRPPARRIPWIAGLAVLLVLLLAVVVYFAFVGADGITGKPTQPVTTLVVTDAPTPAATVVVTSIPVQVVTNTPIPLATVVTPRAALMPYRVFLPVVSAGHEP